MSAPLPCAPSSPCRTAPLYWCALDADHLPVGTQRRVAVACKFMNCGQLLILHDALFGVNEGDGLAVLKALSDMCRWVHCTQLPHVSLLPSVGI